MGNDRQGKSTQRDARAAATHLAPQCPRYDKLSHVCYDKWSHLPNCLSWLCSALVSGVAENVPGKNSGRFWENFLYDKRLPWADRQVWVRVCMPLAWSGYMDGSHQNVPVKNLRRFWEDFLMRNYRQGDAHAKGCAPVWGQSEPPARHTPPPALVAQTCPPMARRIPAAKSAAGKPAALLVCR